MTTITDLGEKVKAVFGRLWTSLLILGFLLVIAVIVISTLGYGDELGLDRFGIAVDDPCDGLEEWECEEWRREELEREGPDVY